jgi:RNA polymerase sigma factor (sigma-70 family)
MLEHRGDSSVDLLLKAQAGDDQALDRLLTRYLPRLRRWASGRLSWPLRSMLDTGDLVQDAVISTLPHLGSLEIRTEDTLWFYLKRAVRHRIIDLHRRASRRPVRHELPEDAQAAGPSPLEAVVGAEALERYEAALDTLKKEDFRAVVLRVDSGLGYKEIAEELGKPSVDAARMAVTRAIGRLAAEMKRLQGDLRASPGDAGRTVRSMASGSMASAHGCGRSMMLPPGWNQPGWRSIGRTLRPTTEMRRGN